MNLRAWLEASDSLEKALSGRQLLQRRQAARSRRKGDRAEYKQWRGSMKAATARHAQAQANYNRARSDEYTRQVDFYEPKPDSAYKPGEHPFDDEAVFDREVTAHTNRAMRGRAETKELRAARSEAGRVKYARSQGTKRHEARRKKQQKVGAVLGAAAAVGAGAYAGNRARRSKVRKTVDYDAWLDAHGLEPIEKVLTGRERQQRRDAARGRKPFRRGPLKQRLKHIAIVGTAAYLVNPHRTKGPGKGVAVTLGRGKRTATLAVHRSIEDGATVDSIGVATPSRHATLDRRKTSRGAVYSTSKGPSKQPQRIVP